MLSVTLNIILAHKVSRITLARETSAKEHRLDVGTTLPPLTAKTLNGLQESISYRETDLPTVLYVFTPTCIWCSRNLDNFKALLKNNSAQYRFIGLSLSEEGLAQYEAKNALGIPVYSGLSPDTLKTYKLGSTPQTIVISPEGKVLQDWSGAYVGTQKSQVEAFFHTTLPGLTAAPEPSSATARGN